MKHAHQTQFGRLATAVQNPSDENGGIDKWEILAALTDAAEVYGLNHRTLGVLKALMSFLPERIITPARCGAIVFPSNRTLATRLNGMPDSTLRRHLAALVASGIVSRHDSANRKRFARRVGNVRDLAFGFDLSPLAAQCDVILAHAAQATAQRQRLAAMRVQVAHLRQRLIDTNSDNTLADDAARALRRKPDAATLAAIREQIEARLDNLAPTEMSSKDAQNERHIQYEDINLSDSDAQQTQCTSDNSPRKPDEGQGSHNKPPQFSQITEICTEYKSYFPEPVRNWHEMAHIADRLIPMMGIETQVFKDAIRHMGLPTAVTAVLCILERLAEITNPGGYLRRLTQKAGAGGLDLGPMLDTVVRRRGLSADNSICRLETCC